MTAGTSPIPLANLSLSPPFPSSSKVFSRDNNGTEASKRRRRGLVSEAEIRREKEQEEERVEAGADTDMDEEEEEAEPASSAANLFLLDQKGSQFVVAEVDRTRRGRFKVEIGPQVPRVWGNFCSLSLSLFMSKQNAPFPFQTCTCDGSSDCAHLRFVMGAALGMWENDPALSRGALSQEQVRPLWR